MKPFILPAISFGTLKMSYMRAIMFFWSKNATIIIWKSVTGGPCFQVACTTSCGSIPFVVGLNVFSCGLWVHVMWVSMSYGSMCCGSEWSVSCVEWIAWWLHCLLALLSSGWLSASWDFNDIVSTSVSQKIILKIHHHWIHRSAKIVRWNHDWSQGQNTYILWGWLSRH